jgi:hypothetical protein
MALYDPKQDMCFRQMEEHMYRQHQEALARARNNIGKYEQTEVAMRRAGIEDTDKFRELRIARGVIEDRAITSLTPNPVLLLL